MFEHFFLSFCLKAFEKKDDEIFINENICHEDDNERYCSRN